MKRETGLLAAVFVLAFAPLMPGQDLSIQPSPLLPSEILGPQLIAWSQVQKPLPVAEALLSSRSAEQEQGQSTAPPAKEQTQSPATQTLTGTIVKDGSIYVLKDSSGTAYQLDDQDRAMKYEGKQVKIAGVLDAKGNSFHIISIELVS